MNKSLGEMTVKEIVEDFNEFAMYQVLKESRRRYKIQDMQLYDVFTVKKKEWYEKIIRYWLEESLIMDELSFKEIADVYTMLDTLEKGIENE